MPKVSVYTSLPGVEISLIFFSCRRKAVGGGEGEEAQYIRVAGGL